METLDSKISSWKLLYTFLFIDEPYKYVYSCILVFMKPFSVGTAGQNEIKLFLVTMIIDKSLKKNIHTSLNAWKI